jgi:hypothetical protein
MYQLSSQATGILRLGADIEILEPAGLRGEGARTIRAMAAIYD